jgi:hypothetical protein
MMLEIFLIAQAEHTLFLVIPRWGPVQRLPGGDLPDPVAELLAIWRRPRTGSELDQLSAYTALERAGYQMRWVQRTPPVPNRPSCGYSVHSWPEATTSRWLMLSMPSAPRTAVPRRALMADLGG